ncbi:MULTISPECIES: carbohydrate kinase [unclassified Rhodococcus (in: high G+C Gram-positive bacteria)]|uniref:carbohydrate kinase family protein n=1 Tax=unclassified Rhodococcus (in: high G+C Gram-positive bacteria) TaxID=192944 RepID=UPI000B9A2B12|nr:MULTISPECIES: carbohydrate kinase [unclassified Rhodococcus (in: high G+C Gram-positive bacteria)]OZE37147.1 carbohydrate kinase [Rhodococcus sp. 05-2254-4]OZE44793.1 carbohydrate kinase [Rhodococcus sp. 05-2254-3]OZE45273.1 carbohydrate kinase [Rhodococcus sp. 05-2254-2]
MTILVCGEALVDLVPVHEGPLLSPKLGGGPFNVAVAIGRLGSPVAYLSRISRDPFGEQILASLRDAGVDTTWVQRGDEPTTLAMTTLAEDGSAEYSFYADGTADRLVADPGDLPDEISVLSFGTLSLLYEPGASMYAGLLHRARVAGKLTMLDPNIRPAAIDSTSGDITADGFRDRFRSWLPSIDILKVSEDDSFWLGLGTQGTTVDDWLAAGVTAVVMTRGGDGISVFTASEEITVPGVAVDVVDTIGAGDTVHGALLSFLQKETIITSNAVKEMSKEDWREALEFAAKAAAITVSRPGADPPWASEASRD